MVSFLLSSLAEIKTAPTLQLTSIERERIYMNACLFIFTVSHGGAPNMCTYLPNEGSIQPIQVYEISCS